MMVSSAAQARTRPITNNRSSPAVLVPRVPGVVRGNAPSRQSLSVTAALKIKEEQTGVEFMVAQKFWKGEDFHCLGAGPRFKKILMLNVKVYAAALFVEGKRAAKEFGVRYRGGFFSNDSDYCDAVLEGAFNKAIIIHLVRDVDGPTFSEAIQKALVPRMQLTGEMDKLAEFTAVFNGKQLSNNTEVVLFWDTTGDLEVVISPPVIEPADYSQVKPDAVIRSAGLTRGLFEVFLGQNSSAPEARAAWIKGAKLLLESENVKRETSKPQ